MKVMTASEYADRTASYQNGPGTTSADFVPGTAVAACHHCRVRYAISPFPRYGQTPPHCAAEEAEGLRNSSGRW